VSGGTATRSGYEGERVWVARSFRSGTSMASCSCFVSVCTSPLSGGRCYGLLTWLFCFSAPHVDANYPCYAPVFWSSPHSVTTRTARRGDTRGLPHPRLRAFLQVARLASASPHLQSARGGWAPTGAAPFQRHERPRQQWRHGDGEQRCWGDERRCGGAGVLGWRCRGWGGGRRGIGQTLCRGRRRSLGSA